MNEVWSLENLAQGNLQNQEFEFACNAMGQAQAHWRPGLGARPEFSAEEQGQIETIPSFRQRLNSMEDLNCIIQSTVTSEEHCGICLENIGLGKVVAKGRHCVHLFHNTCISGWWWNTMRVHCVARNLSRDNITDHVSLAADWYNALVMLRIVTSSNRW